MTKNDFVRRFAEQMKTGGFVPLPLFLGGRFPLFFALQDDLVLLLILEFARGRVTASWYLGVSFEWGYVPEGVPATIYRRVSAFLSIEERRHLCGQEETAIEGHGSWWGSLSEETLTRLVRTISLSKPRFLAQASATELRRSKYGRERRELLRKVRVQAGGGPPELPRLGDAGTMQPWLTAAMTVASETEGLASSAEYLQVLAEDAAACAAAGLLG